MKSEFEGQVDGRSEALPGFCPLVSRMQHNSQQQKCLQLLHGDFLLHR
jgi:hypothetical protein